MAYQDEPQGNGVPPAPSTDGSWSPIVMAVGVLIAFAYWFFSVDWERRFQPVKKPSARAGAALTDQRHLKEKPVRRWVNDPTQHSGATR
jgi:hypothetical protein